MPRTRFARFIHVVVCWLFVGSLAQAGTVNDITASLDSPLNPGTPWEFFGNHVGQSGDFTDTWTFTLTAPTAVSVSVEEARNFMLQIGGLQAMLDSETQSLSFTTETLQAGTHSLIVTGSADGAYGGIYSGTLSAVPLPAAAWMFGSALVALLTFARRRNQREQYA